MNRMILSAFFFNPQGDHRMSWRHPRAPGREIFGLEYYLQLAVAAENAVMDIVFVADHVAIWDSFQSAVAHYANARLEPITLLSVSQWRGRPAVPGKGPRTSRRICHACHCSREIRRDRQPGS
jgi:hypothetical protein